MKNKYGIEINDELIVKYLAGEASPDEAESLHDWLLVPDNKTHFEGLQHTWTSMRPSIKPLSITAKNAWADLNTKLNSSGSVTRHRLQPSSFILKIAASVLIVFSSGLFLYYFLQEEQPISEITILANENSRTITLPDNSEVVLYRSGSISYAENFGLLNREIKFSGEGFFRVTGNVGKPFVIHTSLADIEVVGTVFNVSLVADQLEVSVEQGNVRVLTQTDSALLQAGHAAVVKGALKNMVIKKTIDINNWGYATHKFSFLDTPLEQVFQQIEKAYPYVIEIKNQDIKNCKLTATFDQVSAAEILNLIGETLDLTVQLNGNTFQIEGKGCPWDQ